MNLDAVGIRSIKSRDVSVIASRHYSVPAIEEAAMPFSVYAAMLSSQLIATVAGRVPEFDVGPSCRESTVSDCLGIERFPRDKLIKAWLSFAAHDRAMCDMEEKISGPPSYIGWLTCLEINANAHSPEANKWPSRAERTGSPCRRCL